MGFHRVNSDQIKARFGNYHIQVLSQDDASRLASLYSDHKGSKVCRTLALTRFHRPVASALAEAHALIREGRSIGVTLTQSGFQVSREVYAEMVARAGDRFENLCAGTVSAGALIHLRLYRLSAGLTEGELYPYAIIAEAHHPDLIPPRSDLPLVSSIELETSESPADEALRSLLTALNWAPIKG